MQIPAKCGHELTRNSSVMIYGDWLEHTNCWSLWPLMIKVKNWWRDEWSPCPFWYSPCRWDTCIGLLSVSASPALWFEPSEPPWWSPWIPPLLLWERGRKKEKKRERERGINVYSYYKMNRWVWGSLWTSSTVSNEKDLHSSSSYKVQCVLSGLL